MKRFTYIFRGVLLTVATVVLCSQLAQAGRIGGALSGVVTIPPYEFVTYDVPFAAGQPAIVTVVGNGNTNLDLNVFDSIGSVVSGVGMADRKMVLTNVARAGMFRIEVRNLGAVPNTVTISTN